MKRKKINDEFDGIQIEENDDISFIAKSVNLLLLRDDNGVYYCISMFPSNDSLRFDIATKEWIPLENQDDIPEDAKGVDLEEAMKIYKANPPFEAFKKLEEIRSSSRKEEWEEIQRNGKMEVIGWMEKGDYEYADRDEPAEIYDQRVAALIKDIIDHDYFFPGDCIQLVPVFSDNKSIGFSDRGWGNIIALSKGQYGDMDYALYAWEFHMEDEEDDFKFPKKGLYINPVIPVYVSNEDFINIQKYIVNFSENEFDNALYLLTKGFGWEYPLELPMPPTFDAHIINNDTDESFDIKDAQYHMILFKADYQEFFDNLLKEHQNEKLYMNDGFISVIDELPKSVILIKAKK